MTEQEHVQFPGEDFSKGKNSTIGIDMEQCFNVYLQENENQISLAYLLSIVL